MTKTQQTETEKEKIEKEIVFFQLRTPAMLSKYKRQLSTYKRSLSNLKGKQALKVADYTSEIKLCEETITQMEKILTNLN